MSPVVDAPRLRLRLDETGKPRSGRPAREAVAKLAGNAVSEFMETSRERPRLPSNPVARLLALAESGVAWMPTFSEERTARRVARRRSG